MLDGAGRALEPRGGRARGAKAIGKGLLKTISKMGISTIQSYCGAQIFEAVGLSRELVDRHFTGTASRIGGVGLDVLAAEAIARHRARLPARRSPSCCRSAAIYAWRRDGEHHMWNPDTIALLQHAVRSGGEEAYEEFARISERRRDAARDAARPAARSAPTRRRCRSRRSSPGRRSSSAS